MGFSNHFSSHCSQLLPPPISHLHMTTGERQTSSPPNWSLFKVAPLLPRLFSRTDDDNVTRGRAHLKDPAINVEEIDLKGFFGGDTASRLFSILEMIALCFQNGEKKHHEMSTESTCYSLSFLLMKRENFHCNPAPRASKYISFSY